MRFLISRVDFCVLDFGLLVLDSIFPPIVCLERPSTSVGGCMYVTSLFFYSVLDFRILKKKFEFRHRVSEFILYFRQHQKSAEIKYKRVFPGIQPWELLGHSHFRNS